MALQYTVSFRYLRRAFFNSSISPRSEAAHSLIDIGTLRFPVQLQPSTASQLTFLVPGKTKSYTLRTDRITDKPDHH
jgi:hypothetical protein